MKIINWLIVLLIFLSIGCFLPVASADELYKDVPPMPGRAKPPPKPGHPPVPAKAEPPKTGRAMPPPPKPGNTMAGPKQAGPPMYRPPKPGHQMRAIPHGQYGEARHKVEHRAGHKAYVHHFTGRDYHNWDERERAIWRGGEWRRQEYMGRFGWWWRTGGMLYFYEEPVYPYPQVVPDVVYELPDDVQLPQEDTEEPPEDPYYYWYYCEDPKGYYPYIPECPGGWMTVVPPPQPPDQ